MSPNATFAYVLDTSPQDQGQTQLLSLDLSSAIDTTKSPLQIVSEPLPPLQNGTSEALTALIGADGNITVVTGDCSQGASATQVWQFAPDEGSATGNGTWTQYQTSDQELGSQAAGAGANYLADGMVFSSSASNTNASVFLFGGMCPFPNSTDDTWTSSAAYSNLMLDLIPQTSDTGAPGYGISMTTSRGPPIAEAGFTITSLPPSYSASSGGQQYQQQEFAMLGGHTQEAFINMSQVALFLLPQESWTFLAVQQAQVAKTDLSVRQSASEIEPRSGHTAVLSEDGSKIFVFGGWVGDVSTPAQPQLAVLELGAGYGGSGQWQWTIPAASGNGPATNSGLYGHGAAMLPGGVMMVYGGHSISPPYSRRLKRATSTTSGQILLYNTTSNTWVQTYNAPQGSVSESGDKTAAPLNMTSQKVGLGVGLAVGFLLLLGLILFYIWYVRRMKRQRQERSERDLLSRSSGSSIGPIGQPFLDKTGFDGRGGDMAALHDDPWHEADRAARGEQMQEKSAATGLFVDMPSPTRGLRRGVGTRNYNYHAAPRSEDKRVSRASGHIHPIAEMDDEDSAEARVPVGDDVLLCDAQAQLKEVERILNSTRRSDPFRDPPNPLGSHPVSPEIGSSVRHLSGGSRQYSPVAARDTTPNWTIEPLTSEPSALDAAGQTSPSRSDERTSSTLSERSHVSTDSTNSITRTMSTRTGALLAAAAAATAARITSRSPDGGGPTEDRTSTMSSTGGRRSPHKHIYTGLARSATDGSSTGTEPLSISPDRESFRTARTTLAQLQSEGEALLGGRPVLDGDDPYRRAMAAHSATLAGPSAPPHDNTYMPAPLVPGRRRQGLLGSLRRAIGVISTGDRSASFTGGRYAETDGMQSATSSPTKERRRVPGGAPQRSVSDGGALLRQKRGKQDWEEGGGWPAYHDDPDPGDWGEREGARSSAERRRAEEEWDVEEAAGKRDVQVMFTVPKSRLRVVNADVDGASVRSASDGALSRTDSVRALWREESLAALRSHSDGAHLRLDSTVEEMEGEGKGKDKSV